ncbi:hypothetical protein L596_024220 [Steinernema carpocapsae]|uniref:Uncharacterized protein n=1 Tax=Steinernema carpocapsae TaxID=34508 RepID=A0A4U5MG37_STECR|nr:hypothetical protein L596_024220 [Steinernema carpocapsae]
MESVDKLTENVAKYAQDDARKNPRGTRNPSRPPSALASGRRPPSQSPAQRVPSTRPGAQSRQASAAPNRGRSRTPMSLKEMAGARDVSPPRPEAINRASPKPTKKFNPITADQIREAYKKVKTEQDEDLKIKEEEEKKSKSKNKD